MAFVDEALGEEATRNHTPDPKGADERVSSQSRTPEPTSQLVAEAHH